MDVITSSQSNRDGAENVACVKSTLGNLLIISICIIVGVNSLVTFSPPEIKAFLSNWTVNLMLFMALGLAVVVAYRQRTYGFGRTYALLVIGLALWFIAGRISTYYEVGAGIESAFPSAVDVLRLGGYVLLAYHLFRMYNTSSRSLVPYWTLLSLSVLVNVVAYGWSVYSTATDIPGQIWTRDMLYNTSYLCMIVALLWHNRLFMPKQDHEGSGGKMIRPYVK